MTVQLLQSLYGVDSADDVSIELVACYRLQNIQVIFLLLGIAMGLFAIVLLLFGFASTGLTRETICDGTKCVRSGVGCAVLVSTALVSVDCTL